MKPLGSSSAWFLIPAVALLADGVKKEDLYPLDMDRAFKKLDELKPHVPQWWASGAQPGQMLIAGQADAAHMWSGRVHTLQEEGAPIKMSWNDGMFNTTSWIVPKGAKNTENAFKLAEYSIQPEVQARVWVITHQLRRIRSRSSQWMKIGQ